MINFVGTVDAHEAYKMALATGKMNNELANKYANYVGKKLKQQKKVKTQLKRALVEMMMTIPRKKNKMILVMVKKKPKIRRINKREVDKNPIKRINQKMFKIKETSV